MNRGDFAGDIHQALVDFATSGREFALAVVLKAAGSTPRKAGTKALIDSAGAILGTIGGGPVEAEAQRAAVEAIRARRPLVFDFALEGSSTCGDEPICGGSMRILIDPTAADQREVYAQAAEARRRRRRGVLLTTIRPGPVLQTAVQWFGAESVPASPGFPGNEAIRSVSAGEAPQLFAHVAPEEGASLEVMVEPVIPPPQLVVAGGGPVGQALALQAGFVGFEVVVIDDRAEFADPALFAKDVVTRCGDIAGELAAMPVGRDTYIAIATRGHRHDEQALAACIHRPAAYLGMIGSRRKVAMLRKAMRESGAATDEELAGVYAPIGLDIAAETVPEIAASIVAQLIAVRRRGSAPRMPTG
jgi:xanthine dehydrogenase accessory factor